jgi:hypothetical protein
MFSFKLNHEENPINTKLIFYGLKCSPNEERIIKHLIVIFYCLNEKTKSIT